METQGLLGPAATSAGTAQVPLSAQRLAVLDHVRDHGPVGVTDTAADLGLHRNTIRAHLDALTGLGLIERTADPAGRRGRPAARYRPSSADPAVPVRAFATLATVLADQLAQLSHRPELAAEAAGVAWGRSLVNDAADAAQPADPHRTVVDILARLGFAPDPAPGQACADQRGLALRRCPLLAAARQHPDIVCRVHLGIVLGMLDQLDAPLAADLVPFAEPGACRLRLGSTS